MPSTEVNGEVDAPPPSYQWRFNRTNLADSAHITGTHSNTMAIASLRTGDAGNYDVVVSNTSGSVTSIVAVVKVANQESPPPSVAPSVIWAREGGGPGTDGSNLGFVGVTPAAGDGKGGAYVAGLIYGQ